MPVPSDYLSHTGYIAINTPCDYRLMMKHWGSTYSPSFAQQPFCGQEFKTVIITLRLGPMCDELLRRTATECFAKLYESHRFHPEAFLGEWKVEFVIPWALARRFVQGQTKGPYFEFGFDTRLWFVREKNYIRFCPSECSSIPPEAIRMATRLTFQTPTTGRDIWVNLYHVYLTDQCGWRLVSKNSVPIWTPEEKEKARACRDAAINQEVEIRYDALRQHQQQQMQNSPWQQQQMQNPFQQQQQQAQNGLQSDPIDAIIYRQREQALNHIYNALEQHFYSAHNAAQLHADEKRDECKRREREPEKAIFGRIIRMILKPTVLFRRVWRHFARRIRHSWHAGDPLRVVEKPCWVCDRKRRRWEIENGIVRHTKC